MHELQPHIHSALERLLERDHDRIADEGRTMVLHLGEVRPMSVVLFHGLSSSPTQFVRFASDLHARGHNVIVPRLPRHGHRDRLTEALSRLTADDLRRTAQQSVDLARDLGDEVVVAGFSLGGLLATWVAQRERVRRAVAIAPFFGVSWMPNRFMAPLSTLMLRMPNTFHWWHPILRERQMPAHGYPRYATHAVAHAYRLARQVLDASGEPLEAQRLIFVMNARETAINNRAVRKLARELLRESPGRVDEVVLRNIPFLHDIIEPLRNSAIAERVYPQLLELIEG
ncbi:MAG: alpha/beta fold hydrolase [Candidatus Baltobacteraceae bacterium]